MSYLASSNWYTSGEGYLYRLDLRDRKPGSDVGPELVFEFPKTARALKGMCLIAPKVLLVADCFAGLIWRIGLDAQMVADHRRANGWRSEYGLFSPGAESRAARRQRRTFSVSWPDISWRAKIYLIKAFGRVPVRDREAKAWMRSSLDAATGANDGSTGRRRRMGSISVAYSRDGGRASIWDSGGAPFRVGRGNGQRALACAPRSYSCNADLVHSGRRPADCGIRRTGMFLIGLSGIRRTGNVSIWTKVTIRARDPDQGCPPHDVQIFVTSAKNEHS